MLKWFGDGDDVGALLAKRQYSKAIKILDRKLRDSPESVSMRLQLADALEKSGDTHRALQILAKLVDDLAAEGFVAKALAILKKIQRIDPTASVEGRLAKLVPETAVSASASASGTSSVHDGHSSVVTSEYVLSDVWIGDAEKRDNFHWSPLFSGLSSEEIWELFSNIRLTVKKPGSIIYTEGEPGSSLYVLANGTARCYRRDTFGRNRQVNLLRSGDFFGTRCVLQDEQRVRTVTAAKECELLEIDKASFDRIATKHPHLREQVLKIAQELEAD
ncbi:MAG: cyclic nucleotide-binding domain-containing protein [Acidobacteriota bacterium]